MLISSVVFDIMPIDNSLIQFQPDYIELLIGIKTSLKKIKSGDL